MRYILLAAMFFGLLITLTTAAPPCYSNSTWYCYPLNNVTNSTGLAGGFQYLNATTKGIGWTLIIYALWIVMLFAMGNYNLLARLAVSGLSFTLISIPTTILTWTPMFVPVVFALISVGSYAALIFSTAT